MYENYCTSVFCTTYSERRRVQHRVGGRRPQHAVQSRPGMDKPAERLTRKKQF